MTFTFPSSAHAPASYVDALIQIREIRVRGAHGDLRNASTKKPHRIKEKGDDPDLCTSRSKCRSKGVPPFIRPHERV